MPLLQDPVLSYCVGAHDAVRVYDAAHAPKNKVSLQGPIRKVYSISNVYGADWEQSLAEDQRLILWEEIPGSLPFEST